MIKDVIKKIILEWCAEVNDRIQNRWNSYSLITEGEKNILPPKIEDIETLIRATLEYNGMGAWIAEFGSGSLLDRNNPYLQQYERTEMFNPERKAANYGFLGRKAGDTVYTHKGTTYKSSGKAYGMHLEWGKKGNSKWVKYEPFEPLHIIKNEIEFALPELKERISMVVKEEIIKSLTFKPYS